MSSLGGLLTVKRMQQIRRAIIVLLVAIAVGNAYAFYVSVLGGSNFLDWDMRGVTTGGWRWVGWFFGAYLSNATIIALCLWLCSRRLSSKIILGVSFLSSMLFLLASLTRAAWLGFGAGLVVVTVFLKGWQKRRLIAIIGVLMVIGVLVVGPFLLVNMASTEGNQFNLLESLWRRVASFSDFEQDISGPLRLGAWSKALELIKERPLLGHGWGSEQFTFVYYFRGRVREETLNSHNSYLDIAVKTGLPGLATFMLFSIGCIQRAKQRLVQSKGTQRTYLLALMAGVIAQLVCALFGSLFVNSTVAIYWISLGLLEATGRINNNQLDAHFRSDKGR